MTHWKHIGKMIKTVRKQRGMTQQDLGDKIGASKQFVSNLETGIKKCSINKLHEVANALDCYLDISLTPLN